MQVKRSLLFMFVFKFYIHIFLVQILEQNDSWINASFVQEDHAYFLKGSKY